MKTNKTKFAFALFLVLLLPSSCLLVEFHAESKARSFCEQFPVGSSFDLVQVQAKSVGDDKMRMINEDMVLVVFEGSTPFSRHVCRIKNTNGKVAEAEYFFLD